MEKKMIDMDLRLNKMHYTEENVAFLTEGELSKYEMNASLDYAPSAVGWDAIMIIISASTIPAVGFIAEGFLTEFGAGLYRWSKNRLRKTTEDKADFDESKIHLTLKDCSINIYANRKEDFLHVTENFEEIIKEAVKDKKEVSRNKQDVDVNVNERKIEINHRER